MPQDFGASSLNFTIANSTDFQIGFVSFVCAPAANAEPARQNRMTAERVIFLFPLFIALSFWALRSRPSRRLFRPSAQSVATAPVWPNSNYPNLWILLP